MVPGGAGRCRAVLGGAGRVLGDPGRVLVDFSRSGGPNKLSKTIIYQIFQTFFFDFLAGPGSGRPAPGPGSRAGAGKRKKKEKNRKMAGPGALDWMRPLVQAPPG